MYMNNSSNNTKLPTWIKVRRIVLRSSLNDVQFLASLNTRNRRNVRRADNAPPVSDDVPPSNAGGVTTSSMRDTTTMAASKTLNLSSAYLASKKKNEWRTCERARRAYNLALWRCRTL